MPDEFNPLADLASILGSIAKALPPLPALPSFPSPKSPEGVATPSFVDINDGLIKAAMEKHRAEQKAKGLVPFYYE